MTVVAGVREPRGTGKPVCLWMWIKKKLPDPVPNTVIDNSCVLYNGFQTYMPKNVITILMEERLLLNYFFNCKKKEMQITLQDATVGPFRLYKGGCNAPPIAIFF